MNITANYPKDIRTGQRDAAHKEDMNTPPASLDRATVSPATPYLTEAEAAAWFSLSPRTLRNWRSLGEGPGFLRLGTAVRYHQGELDQWALAQKAVA